MGETENRVVGLKGGGQREFRSKEERRRIVEETFKPGTSVALVARANGVNANQVFKWRAQYKKGRLGNDSPTALIPVRVSETTARVPVASRRRSKARPSGVMDIDLGHARIRIEGRVDPECVRAALEGLAR